MTRSDSISGYDGCRTNDTDIGKSEVVMAKIPKFDSEREEAQLWETHDSTQFLGETEPVDMERLNQEQP